MLQPAVRLLAVSALALCAACGGDGPPSDEPSRPLVGVTLLTQTHDFFKDLEAGLRDEAGKRGLDVVVTACEMDPAKQASQIEDFVTQGVAAILAAPCDSAAIGANLAVAEAAGIPVFTADIAAHAGRIVSHVASDNYQGGRLAAEALAGYLGGKGKVLIIDHPTVASVQDRTRGFDEVMSDHPEIEIVGRPSADGQRARAMSIMEDMLQVHPDLAGVFGINDDSALGALAVLQAAGRDDVVIVGFDATPAAREAIAAGTALRADVMQSPDRIGRTAIEMIDRHLKGESVPELVEVEVALVDRESLESQGSEDPAPAP